MAFGNVTVHLHGRWLVQGMNSSVMVVPCFIINASFLLQILNNSNIQKQAKPIWHRIRFGFPPPPTSKGRFLPKFTCLHFGKQFSAVQIQESRLPPSGPQGAGSPENSQSARRSFDWRVTWTNQPIASSFPTASHLAAMCSYRFRGSQARLVRQNPFRNLTASQVRAASRGCFPPRSSLLFPRSTTHCEPGVVTVKEQPLEVQPFRQHEQKEKGLEDWER